MSEWQENIKNFPLVPITTGDGETYNVKMKIKGGSIDPLTASYNYPGKIGTKPKRNSTASPVFDLNFYIDQDQLGQFIDSISCFDEEWLVKHPLFGNLKGQPIGNMVFDNSKQGDVPFVIQFQQSIEDSIPLIIKDYNAGVITTNTIIQTQAIDTVGFLDFTPSEITLLSDFVDNLEDSYDSILNNEYVNKLYDIRQLINDITFDAYRFMSAINDLLNLITRLRIDILPDSVLNILTSSVDARNNIIQSQSDVILALDIETLNMIIFKENAGACNITALTQTVITPAESVNKLSGFDVTDETETTDVYDYKYKEDVTNTINKTNLIFNSYIENISEIDFTKEDLSVFTPNNVLNDNVVNSVFLAIQEIKELSVKSKEVSIFTTVSDTTAELLAFELYGSATDENINSIINDNDLMGTKSLENSWRNLIIRKDTNIVYYA